MALEAIIKEKLEKALKPEKLVLTNESYKHRGHAGDDGSGESHWHVHIVSSEFIGENRVSRQRMVMDVLKEELNGRIHALSIRCDIP